MSLIKASFLNIFRRKVRSTLTFLGISIGIALLITLISVVDGISSDAQDTISKLSGVFVYSKSVPDPIFGGIDTSYLSKIKSIPGVDKVIKERYRTVGEIDDKKLVVSFGGNVVTFGVDPKDLADSSYGSLMDNIISGRLLKTTDKSGVIIGKDTAKNYNKRVGDTIKIDDSKFKIIGIYEMKSNLGSEPIIISEKDIIDKFGMDEKKVNDFYVISQKGVSASDIAKKIEFKLDDVQAQGSQDLQEQIDSLLYGLKFAAIIISLISALVAGIGIINTMLMSVFERTKEIGTLKAVGWTRYNIMSMIALETLFIALIGTFVGIIIGTIISFAIGSLYGITTIVTISLIIENIIFGIFLGIFGGLYPALKASQVDPVVALRDE